MYLKMISHYHGPKLGLPKMTLFESGLAGHRQGVVQQEEVGRPETGRRPRARGGTARAARTDDPPSKDLRRARGYLAGTVLLQATQPPHDTDPRQARDRLAR